MGTQPHTPRRAEAGGITILVVLSLLTLLTVAAMGMSRNSLRDMMIVGTSRQAANVRQAADAGLDFAVLWANPTNVPSETAALDYQSVARTLLQSQELQGEYKDVASGKPTADTTLTDTTTYKQAFNLQLLRLGKLPAAKTSVPDERLYNDLWVVRSSGVVTVGTTQFQHDKEMWLSTPVQATN
jgi:hypothetical protein